MDERRFRLKNTGIGKKGSFVAEEVERRGGEGAKILKTCEQS